MLGLGLGITSIVSPSPGTLPNGTEPLIFMDFENGEFVANGDSVTIGDLFTENTNFGTWNATSVVPATGLVGQIDGENSNATLTGAAATLLLSGATILVRFTMVDDLSDGDTNFGRLGFDMFSGSFETEYYGNVANTLFHGVISDADEQVNVPGLALGEHAFAATIEDGRLSISVDGGAVLTINPALPWEVAPTSATIQAFSGVTVQSLGFYPPQDDADLPMLSALA